LLLLRRSLLATNLIVAIGVGAGAAGLLPDRSLAYA